MAYRISHIANRKLIKENKINKIIFLVGPTAVGKSKIAVSLAKKINAEIISCDSMQVYKEMDVISSKPSALTRKKIRHYLIDVISVGQEYNVARYRSDALKKIRQVIRQDKIPLFVGGSGLYMSILVDGLFKAKAQNKALRRKLYAEAQNRGNQVLYERLKKIDPEAARKIHPHDTRRIVRALEVYKTTGRPISELQRQREGLSDKYDIRIFCLDMKRDRLYRRIDSRVEKMFKQGLVAEVKNLLKLKLSKTASCVIGIKELKGYFEGLYNLEEAMKLMKKNTRNYAKRQLTWFRKDKRIEWVEVDEKDIPVYIADRIVKKLMFHSA